MSFVNFNYLNVKPPVFPNVIEKEKNKKIEIKPTEEKDEFVSSCDHSKKPEYKSSVTEDKIALQEKNENKISRGRIVACAGGSSN